MHCESLPVVPAFWKPCVWLWILARPPFLFIFFCRLQNFRLWQNHSQVCGACVLGVNKPGCVTYMLNWVVSDECCITKCAQNFVEKWLDVLLNFKQCGELWWLLLKNIKARALCSSCWGEQCRHSGEVFKEVSRFNPLSRNQSLSWHHSLALWRETSLLNGKLHRKTMSCLQVSFSSCLSP